MPKYDIYQNYITTARASWHGHSTAHGRISNSEWNSEEGYALFGQARDRSVRICLMFLSIFYAFCLMTRWKS